MVKEGIVLGHKVSSAGLEVDKAKIDVISKLPPPTNIKITPFEFDDECRRAFESLKEKLTCAPIIVSPNWNLPFELMCDASDFAIGAILGQKDEIKDRKGTENVTADHLSRLDNNETSDDSKVDDNFPEETLMEININEPWNLISSKYAQTAEAQALPTNDARVVVAFLKKLFCRFRMPKALISDRVVKLKTRTELKRILEKTIKDNPAIWSRKLDDALLAFRTTYKTSTDLTAAGEKTIFQLHELDELRQQAYENTRLYKERTKVCNLARRYGKL
ncbi:reverse transcriptase domain-containing protein [Tanacetum coccineum]